MAHKVKDLAVKTREYVDKEGNKKANWQNIGSIMQNDDGSQFLLLDRWVNLGGLPDFSGKPNPSAVLINIFDPSNRSNYQPTAHDKAKQDGYQPDPGQQAAGSTGSDPSDLDDDIPF